MASNKEINLSKNSSLNDLKKRAGKFQGQSKSKNTLLAYEKDWANFSKWCHRHSLQDFPADDETICLYMVQQSDLVSVPTIRNRLAAIRNYHIDRGHPNPCKSENIRKTMRGISREKLHKPKQAQGLSKQDLMLLSKRINQNDLIQSRDIAILWTAFSGGLRRGEVMALDVSDLLLPEIGAGSQFIQRSKTDQEGKGRHAALLPEAVKALRNWLSLSGVTEGALFRRVFKEGKRGGRIGPRMYERGIELSFKNMAKLGNMDPKKITTHSARVGVAQELVSNGATTAQIAQACGWKGDSMPARYAAQLEARRNAVTTLLA